MRLFFTVSVTAISIWHHVGFHNENFFLDMEVSHWLKEGSLGHQSFTFAATVWWAWRHRNLMCLNNEIWTLSRFYYIIHSMIDSFDLCFKIILKLTRLTNSLHGI